MTGTAPASARTPLDWIAGSAVVLAVVLAAAWRITDCETYMRLAIARATVGAGLVMREDPFIFSHPGLPWRNPEWLGDLLSYGVFRAGGEPALVMLKLLLLGSGWGLLYLLGRRLGGSPAAIAGLCFVALGASAWRLTERNEMHLHWLVPAYGLTLLAARSNTRWLWAVVGLGLLWPHLHGSFTIGWIILAAASAEAWFGTKRDPRRARTLAALLAVHLLFPALGPDGLHTYALVLEHLRYAESIRRLIEEWRPPSALPATLDQLPLHLLGIVGLASFLPRPNRRQVQGFVMFTAGLVFAHGSQRFLLVFALLAIPAIAANLESARVTFGPRVLWPARVGTLALVAGGIGLLMPVVVEARNTTRAEDRVDYPVKASRWLGRHARQGTRLFMPYTGSQWVMWEAPQIRLYIHPQLTYGGHFLLQFLHEIAPNPTRFEDEVRRWDIDLALVELSGQFTALAAHLDRSADWKPVYFDGHYAVYARSQGPNGRSVAEGFGFRVIRGIMSFDYLAAVPEDMLAPDRARLAQEAPVLAQAIDGFRLLRTRQKATSPDSVTRARHARALLEPALDALPSSPALFAYTAEACFASGDLTRARALTARGLRAFPQSSRLKNLAAALSH